MSTDLPVIFLAFANDRSTPLEQLNQEDQQLRSILYERGVNKGHFYLHHESHADLDTIRTYLSRFRGKLWLFHYAGHADGQQLFLPGGHAQASGMAAMLAEQPNLKLVFLNGCSTYGQVKELLSLGVPAIIATHRPIDDSVATLFAKYFYQALESGVSIKQAFDEASNFIQSTGRSKPVFRSLTWDSEETNEGYENLWGLFYRPERSDVIDERLPGGNRPEPPPEFKTNQILTDAIWQALIEYGIPVEENPSKPRGRRKRNLNKHRIKEILQNLPAPIVEPLRKLLAIVPEEPENSYDKISTRRLRQLAKTYQVMMELMTSTLLAQLWECVLNPVDKNIDTANYSLPTSLRESVTGYLEQRSEERERFPFIRFIRQLRGELDRLGEPYFVEELANMASLMNEESSFRKACSYFDFLRARLVEEDDLALQSDVNRLCIEAEEHLAQVFTHLGFLARYTLATVKDILVQKYRHNLKAKFQHVVVRLLDLKGFQMEEREVFGEYLDSQSVLLLKEDEDAEIMPFLNLSPFVIDETAFVVNSGDVSVIYFLHHRQSYPDGWVYHCVSESQKAPLVIPREDFKPIQEQILAFTSKFGLA